jgi:hypothetical protein
MNDSSDKRMTDDDVIVVQVQPFEFPNRKKDCQCLVCTRAGVPGDAASLDALTTFSRYRLVKVELTENQETAILLLSFLSCLYLVLFSFSFALSLTPVPLFQSLLLPRASLN